MPDIAPRRWLYLFLVLASTVAAVTQMAGVLQFDGFTWREIVILALFAILFSWVAMSFWLTVFGAWVHFTKTNLLPLKPAGELSAARTAILMPVYNEDVARVFSAVQAIWESAGADFDFYVLSDSTNPANWVAEELEWKRLKDALGESARIFYRHRPRNTGRKAGNIQDFCENWGQLYDYMVILDADSLMTGKTLAHLVGLMDANPRVALIQAPPQLVGRQSLFARMLQFASSIYGPLHASGLAFLQGPDGNYWGHNAIIRVHAFMQQCGLPRLPGRPPFGGEIMSHDFIEAALLRRAGWEVWMAPGIGGSFEEPPPSLLDYLIRDRRWCQGNLQHFKILFAQGLTIPSRLHLAMGIMSYVSSPLWLLLLAVSVADMMTAGTSPLIGLEPALPPSMAQASALVILVVATLVMLYGPKILAVIALLEDPHATRAHGGTGKVLLSAFWEAVFATLMAPIVMLQHSWFVFTILMGMATGWNAQARADRALPLALVIGKFAPHTIAGIGAAMLLQRYAPGSYNWFLPLLAGLWFAIPLALLSSSPLLGKLARGDGLFLTPSETRGSKVLSRAHTLTDSYQADACQPVRAELVLEDAQVRDLHLALLADTPVPPADPLKLWSLRERARRGDTAQFSRDDWTVLLSDSESVKALSLPS
ncbi:MAG TPA: glucans biosynthesis glucosyltransferase MdoH [Rhizomicrobium sp.]|nr:glucans biosynthesis glucosyltransferase MdoH [Rhizomicrobium sp.]